MTPQPSRFPWLAVIAAGLLALAGLGLLAFAVLSIISIPTRPVTAPVATAKPATQAIAQSNATAVIIPTITQAPQTAPTQAVGATAEPKAPAATSAAPTSAAATSAPDTALPATATSAEVGLKILQPANVRSGPGLVYPIIGGLQAGTTVPVEGRDANGQWFAVKMGAVVGWVSGIVSAYSGDVGALPVIAAPPTPIPPTPVPPTPIPPTAVPVFIPTNPPAPVGYSSHGIVGNSFSIENPEVNTDQTIWFNFKVTNNSAVLVEYSALAGHTDSGFSAWSWTNSSLKPGETLEWRDHIDINKPGTYQVYLGICYAGSRDACASAGWDHLSPSITVTVH